MPKASTTYECTACGYRSPVELGRCPRCGGWGSLELLAPEPPSGPRAARRETAVVRSLAQVGDAELQRVSSGMEEVDRVLGGGWVGGSVLLLAGEPGIGKSTLLLQLADLALRAGRSVLYVAGEESPAQVKLRAERLGVRAELGLTREVEAPTLASHISATAPHLVIVDSIQTLVMEEGAAPGGVTQVRDSTALLTAAAKEAGSTLVLIGHVTKQGSIAGPKVIEHIVDATLALESAAGFRVMRALKNRFGAAGEMGVFEMTSSGMQPVANPSEAFLAERPQGVPGSVVAATLEGQRPLLLEVQALAAKTPYPAPRRVVQGLDTRRVDVVLAVLERRLELPLAGLDVFVNVAGGLRLTDPGTDLAVALAVYSAVTNRTLPSDSVAVGEIGLAGEVRAVPQLARRYSEARRAGYERFVGPRSADLPGKGCASLREAIAILWGER